MNKLIPIFLIIGVLVISGCTQSMDTQTNDIPTDTTSPPTDSGTVDTGSSNSQLNTTSSEEWEWIQIEGENIKPTSFYKNTLYGTNTHLFVHDIKGNYKLVNDTWEEIKIEGIKSLLFHNDIPYIFNGDWTFKLEDGEWKRIDGESGAKALQKPEGLGKAPAISHNDVLYGYGGVFGQFTHKLVNDKWRKIEGSVKPILIHKDALYGYGNEGSSEGKTRYTYILVNDKWKKILGEEVRPVISNDKVLYGYDGTYTYKLVGNEWKQVGKIKVNPSVFNEEILYGYDGTYTYKLEEDGWVKIGIEVMEPMVSHNNILYGYGKDDSGHRDSNSRFSSIGTYKLEKGKWVKVVTDGTSIHPRISHNNILYGDDCILDGSYIECYTYKLIKK